MLLDYNSNEKKEINAIEAHFKPLLDRAYNQQEDAAVAFEKLNTDAQKGKRSLNDDEAEIVAEYEQTQTEYARLLDEYEEKRKVITSKAEEREAKYFATHTQELTKRLKIEIQAQIASFGILKEHDDIKAIYQNDDEMINHLIMVYRQYLDILQKQDNESYQHILSFIDSSIADKESITETYKMTLRENPAKSSRWDEPYLYMSQNNATNDFNKTARLSPKKGILQQWGEMLTYQQGNLIIEIPHYDQLLENSSIGKSGELNTPTKKILDIATIIFSNNGHDPSIRFSLDDYMKLCGLTDKKEARKQVNAALEVLFDVSISYDDSKNKNKSRNYRDMRLVDDKGIKNGIVYLHIAHGFSEMLADCPVMPYPIAMLKTSVGREHRNSYYIARKMAEHKNMNVGKRNENIISVRALLEAAPYLPTVDEVRNSNSRSITDRIINPFLADLDEACISLGIGSEGYDLHYAGGAEIPDDELLKLDYETFINAYVRFDELPDYPDQTKRLEAKAAREKAEKETPKKKSRKKKKGD